MTARDVFVAQSGFDGWSFRLREWFEQLLDLLGDDGAVYERARG